jgi:hypothetical protein
VSWRDILAALRNALDNYAQAMRHSATDRIEWETHELENIFALLVLGVFVGLPSPPMQLTLELMPLMERELVIMINRADTAHDPLSELFSTLDVG